MATIKKIKKAQGGDKLRAKADATRVAKPIALTKKSEEKKRNAQVASANSKGESYAGYSIGSRGAESNRYSDSAHKYFNKADSIKNVPTISQKNGGKTMIKRADGSTSQRGLWDNIRAAKGSGKKPTAAMLKQEKKIKAKTKK